VFDIRHVHIDRQYVSQTAVLLHQLVCNHITLQSLLTHISLNFGDRCFTAASPKLRNSLLDGLKQMDIVYEQFKWLIKTYLFGR